MNSEVTICGSGADEEIPAPRPEVEAEPVFWVSEKRLAENGSWAIVYHEKTAHFNVPLYRGKP